MGSPVVHFEIQASDRPALAQFYAEVFGWTHVAAPGMPYTLLGPTGEDPSTGEEPSSGIGGGMLDRNGPAPQDGAGVNGFVCVIQVDDLDETHRRVDQHGGRIVVEPMDVQGVGRVFYFTDPDGNLAGVLQPA